MERNKEMKTKGFKLSLVLVLSLSLLGMGCSASNAVKGGAIGAGAGAVIGGVIGNQVGSTAVGAIIGAAVGGTAGALIGNYMDKQAEEIQNDIKDAKVERIGEGIKITFNSGILFETNSADLQPTAKANIEKLSTILNKYQDTIILIEGHTDSTGTEAYNQTLSEKRSQSVAQYTQSQGVATTRFTVKGYGESQPLVSNSTSDGRRQNRRVEVAIMANDDLKKAAEKNQMPQ
jgi:outer membrane protein OmpA-like peptidoglycan-associated protein